MTMSRDQTDHRPSVPSAMPAQNADVVHDANGLVVDEYSDDTFDTSDDVDALDRRGALENADVLSVVTDDDDGITEIDLSELKTDDGHADMGLGAEPRSADELDDAAIGHELKGAAGVTRDDEVHGERMFDSPDGTGRDIPEGERD